MTDLALSSYWRRGCWERIGDFFRAGVEMGFSCFEVSGLAGDAFYQEIRPGAFDVASLHNPAPGEMRNSEMRRADILLTSLDEERRQRAVAITRRTLEVAQEYGARLVVLHVGQTGADQELENDLKRLFAEGRIADPEADIVQQRLASERLVQRQERMEAVRRSLDELILCASARGICLGVENRTACEVPDWHDLGEILSWYPEEPVGYVHDTGHAQAQEALGLRPHVDWLHAYGHRLAGVHLHDSVRLDVHRAPGTGGDLDWAGLAGLVPVGVLRTVEVDGTVSREALLAGIEHLKSTGWA
jgi:sugar phosphate isomerase/epimerase